MSEPKDRRSQFDDFDDFEEAEDGFPDCPKCAGTGLTPEGFDCEYCEGNGYLEV